jgi:hypothetical protein
VVVVAGELAATLYMVASEATATVLVVVTEVVRTEDPVALLILVVVLLVQPVAVAVELLLSGN